jgi:hypothetical protein
MQTLAYNIYALHDQTEGVGFRGDKDHCRTKDSHSCRARKITSSNLFDATTTNCVCNPAVQFGFTYTLGGLVTFCQGCCLYISMSVIYCELFLTGDLAHEICKNWAIRYSGLRRVESVTIPSVQNVSDDENKVEAQDLKVDDDPQRGKYAISWRGLLFVQAFLQLLCRKCGKWRLLLSGMLMNAFCS